MKIIEVRGKKYEQNTEVLNCIFCSYCVSCDGDCCCSPSCEITNECFGYKSTGSWCPFGEIPKHHLRTIKVITEK